MNELQMNYWQILRNWVEGRFQKSGSINRLKYFQDSNQQQQQQIININ